MSQIRIIAAPGSRHIAVIHHNTLLDYALWYPGWSDGLGDIHYGRVTARIPTIGGVFVLLHNGLSGFLPDKAGGGNLHEGNGIIVKITRSAQGGKNVRLTAQNLEAHTRKIEGLHLIAKGISPLEELAQRWKESPILFHESFLIHEIPLNLRDRTQKTDDTVSTEILDQIATLTEPQIELPMGMSASITPTPALTAIDMDSTRFEDNHQPKIRAQFQANRNALPFLLNQLKLRNLSGAILIDLIGLPIKKRRLLQQDIEKQLATDPLSPKLLGFTHLGLAEIIRPKKRPPLHELLSSNHGQVIHLLNQMTKNFLTIKNHYQYRKIVLKLNIDWYQTLLQDSWALQDFERHCSVTLQPEASPAFGHKQWEVSYE